MRMTLQQVLDHQARVAGSKISASRPVFEPAEKEVGKGGLHEEIMRWCDSQWPRVKYIHSRADQRSTIGVGVHDFTIYLPGGRVLNVECKAGNRKPTPEQLAWAKELEMLGHRVCFCWSMAEFLSFVTVPGQ